MHSAFRKPAVNLFKEILNLDVKFTSKTEVNEVAISHTLFSVNSETHCFHGWIFRFYRYAVARGVPGEKV